MPALSLPFDPEKLPRAAQAGRAEVGVERLIERASGDTDLAVFVDTLVKDAGGRQLLDAIFGNSPFLGQCLLNEIGFLRDLLDRGPEAMFDDILETLDSRATSDEGQDALMSRLRRAKRRVALLIAIADIADLWPLGQITGSLSKFADAATHLTTAHLLQAAATQGALTLHDTDDPNLGSGYFVLGMGKLGAD